MFTMQMWRIQDVRFLVTDFHTTASTTRHAAKLKMEKHNPMQEMISSSISRREPGYGESGDMRMENDVRWSQMQETLSPSTRLTSHPLLSHPPVWLARLKFQKTHCGSPPEGLMFLKVIEIWNGMVILWLTVVVITKLFATFFPWLSWVRMVLRVGKATVTIDEPHGRLPSSHFSMATLPQRSESEKTKLCLQGFGWPGFIIMLLICTFVWLMDKKVLSSDHNARENLSTESRSCELWLVG